MTRLVRMLVVSLAVASCVSGLSAPANGGTAVTTTIDGYIGFFGHETSYTLTRPASTTISATFHATSGGSEGKPLELWRRPYGGSWQLLDTILTNGTNTVSRTVTPVHNTLYKWHFDGNSQQAASDSVLLTVKVRYKVTLRLDDSSLRVGQRLVARGVVRPIKAGVTATLWRITLGDRVKLATGTIRIDGSYRITYVFRRHGPKYLVVTVPASTGNLKGTSESRPTNVG